MILWRISEFSTLDGGGGLLVPGRWHSKGRRIVYLAETSALAMLEVLVQLEVSAMPPDFQLHRIDAPDHLEFVEWPKDDDHSDALATKAWGDSWLDGGSTALARVPSAIAPFGMNWLLNPLHGDARNVTLEESNRWPWDPRLAPALP